jgi:hypothetical protein
MIRFTLADLEHAHAAWSCNCGPAALAAICGLTLVEVRPHFPGFKGLVTTPQMIFALKSARPHARFTVSTYRDHGWPRFGLARIQWEGPWTAPGADPKWASRFTHWVGASQGEASGVEIWDVNALDVNATFGDGWAPLKWWKRDIVAALTGEIQNASGGWHITHAIEVERP